MPALTIEDGVYSPNTGNRWTNLQPPFTVECFFKFLSTDVSGLSVQLLHPFFSIYRPGMNHFKIAVGIADAVGVVQLQATGTYPDGGGISTLAKTITGYSGKWGQVAVRIDTLVASTLSLVINGVEIASAATTAALLSTTATTGIVASVGCDVYAIGFGPLACFATSKATIDDIFIYNSYMSVEDLKEHWDMTGQPTW